MQPPANVTQLLDRWSQGDQAALDELLPLVYDELHRLASSYLRRERADHTLQPTALVNEAYLRLIDQHQSHWQNRAQFFGVAAQLMRRILVDHARAHLAAKRGGAAIRRLAQSRRSFRRTAGCQPVSLARSLERIGGHRSAAKPDR